jgi:ADP-heptose:LPS heptosyltransferase
MGKDIDLQQLAPLLNLPNQYVCVQKNVTQEDAQLLDYYGVERPPLRTFADTVRILETCERVVCVDTSVTHLAASMGIPTWVLLPYNACWRWLIYRPDSPWYPSIRLFRQNTRNQWDDPIQDIVNNLPA